MPALQTLLPLPTDSAPHTKPLTYLRPGHLLFSDTILCLWWFLWTWTLACLTEGDSGSFLSCLAGLLAQTPHRPTVAYISKWQSYETHHLDVSSLVGKVARDAYLVLCDAREKLLQRMDDLPMAAKLTNITAKTGDSSVGGGRSLGFDALFDSMLYLLGHQRQLRHLWCPLLRTVCCLIAEFMVLSPEMSIKSPGHVRAFSSTVYYRMLILFRHNISF